MDLHHRRRTTKRSFSITTTTKNRAFISSVPREAFSRTQSGAVQITNTTNRARVLSDLLSAVRLPRLSTGPASRSTSRCSLRRRVRRPDGRRSDKTSQRPTPGAQRRRGPTKRRSGRHRRARRCDKTPTSDRRSPFALIGPPGVGRWFIDVYGRRRDSARPTFACQKVIIISVSGGESIKCCSYYSRGEKIK